MTRGDVGGGKSWRAGERAAQQGSWKSRRELREALPGRPGTGVGRGGQDRGLAREWDRVPASVMAQPWAMGTYVSECGG